MKRLITLVLLVLALAPVATTSAAPRAHRPEQIEVAGLVLFAPIMDEQGAPRYQILTPLDDGAKCLVSILATETFTGPPVEVTPATNYLEGTGLVFLRVYIDRPCLPEVPPGSSTERGEVHGTISGTLRAQDGTVFRTGTFDFFHRFRVDDAGNFSGRTMILAGTEGLAGISGMLRTRSSGTDPDAYSGRITFDS